MVQRHVIISDICQGIVGNNIEELLAIMSPSYCRMIPIILLYVLRPLSIIQLVVKVCAG